MDVVIDPSCDLKLSMREAHEQRLIENLVAHPAAKALAEAFLHWLIRCYAMPLYGHFSAPCEHGIDLGCATRLFDLRRQLLRHSSSIFNGLN